MFEIKALIHYNIIKIKITNSKYYLMIILFLYYLVKTSNENNNYKKYLVKIRWLYYYINSIFSISLFKILLFV